MKKIAMLVARGRLRLAPQLACAHRAIAGVFIEAARSVIETAAA